MIRTIHGFAFLMVLTGVVSAWGLMLVGLNYQLDKRQLLIREEELSRAAASLALLAAKDDRTRGGRGPAGVWVRDMAKLWPYRVSLLNEDGRYEADSRLTSLDRGEESYQTPSEVSGAFADGSAHSRRFSYFLGQEYLYAAARVDYENAPPKVLRMGVSIDDLNQQRRQLLKFYFPVAGVGLALAMLVGWFGTRRLARDYQVINQAAQDLASGDLSHRLALSRLPSELGQTGQALNQLADSLSGQLALAEERQHHLLAVLEAMDEGVLVLDEQGLVTQTNRRLEEMLRLPAVQPGLPLALNIRRPELVADFEAIRRGQQPPPRLIHDHGPPERFIEVRFSPIQGGGVVAVFHDLTNRHLLYQMRREFVANISHELRTPLTAIMGVAEIMRDQSPADDEFRPWLDALDRQARRLNTLAREILELARLEDIKAQPLRRESIPVKNLLAAMSERIPPEARSQLSLDSDVDDLEFSGDWDSLLGALANLVDNAVKYGEPGGRITLQARRYGDLVELAVINQGAPVDPEDRERIFERFYRSEKSRREGLGGVGLGLAIVKHVARVHGGRAYLKCPSGGGSVFTMSLPIKG